MPRVVHFEFLSDDPEQSVKFFQDVVRLAEPVVARADLLAGRHRRGGARDQRRDHARERLPAHAERRLHDRWSTTSATRSAKVEAAGGKVIAPERQVGEAGWAAYAADPQGVVFGLWKSA